jgi:flagellar biosynthesis chaperone FliJ
MNANEIIREVQENASEYLEMVDNPEAFVSGVLATKIVKLQNYIEYLEKRLDYANKSSNNRL